MQTKHTENPIFSCDIQMDGTRFVTGGADNHAKIWSLKALLKEIQEVDSSAGANTQNALPIEEKLLCTVSHAGPVNCVRFSPDSRNRLATCSDDRTVVVWQFIGSISASTAANSLDKNIERWSMLMTFTGHTADVTGVCWSPDGNKLASCSTDNTIKIWDINKKCNSKQKLIP